MRVSACVIVKNEEENILRWIGQMKKLAFQLIVVDTGSTDQTVDLVRQAGIEPYFYQWKNDFSAAKNFALSQATGEWILFLDADEYFCQQDVSALHAYMEEQDEKGIEGVFSHKIDIDTDNGNRVLGISENVRIFKNDKRIHFVNPVHEILQFEERSLCLGKSSPITDLYHTGYSRHVVEGKARRNLALLEENIREKGETSWHWPYLADCYYELRDYEKVIFYAKKALPVETSDEARILLHQRLIESVILFQQPVDADAVLKLFDAAIAEYPLWPLFFWKKAEVLYVLESFAEAETVLLQALHAQNIQKNNHEIGDLKNQEYVLYELLGKVYKVQGLDLPALQCYKKALQLDLQNENILVEFYALLEKKSPLNRTKVLQDLYQEEADKIFLQTFMKHQNL